MMQTDYPVRHPQAFSKTSQSSGDVSNVLRAFSTISTAYRMTLPNEICVLPNDFYVLVNDFYLTFGKYKCPFGIETQYIMIFVRLELAHHAKSMVSHLSFRT